jgi:hypothetical protein
LYRFILSLFAIICTNINLKERADIIIYLVTGGMGSMGGEDASEKIVGVVKEYD